ncbi:threonyl-tRNA synthetase [Paraphysoderma sedebokerense]|nr:threonyl-tRNA synthetase [Paraphysoderma sedebokerense]
MLLWISPGSVFMLPHGTRIINKLISLIRSAYVKYGYEEVMTPLIFKKKLWEVSGHWENYREDMFLVNGNEGLDDATVHLNEKSLVETKNVELDVADEEVYGLKPMNCPAHCLIFASTNRSYRELPIRLADFSSLHRNEASGALSGLTRVRRFHQDDAHIFCSTSQITSEITQTLNFLTQIYSIFRFHSYKITLSTRPEKNYIGSLSTWEQAESSLQTALENLNLPYTVSPGDGAFYGPKIDLQISDSSNKLHQCGTIQLDFQLPSRFNLVYENSKGGFENPVIIHRAVLGSLERMFAILCEHYHGKWPFWLSPRQGIVIPVTMTNEEIVNYAQQVKKDDFTIAGGNLSYGAPNYYVDVDLSNLTLSKKIRNAVTKRYNFIFIVGENEMRSKKVNVSRGTWLGDELVEEYWKSEENVGKKKNKGMVDIGAKDLDQIRTVFRSLERRFA